MRTIISKIKNLSLKNKIIFSTLGTLSLTSIVATIVTPIVVSKKSLDKKTINKNNKISRFLKMIGDNDIAKNIFDMFLLRKKDENINYIKNDFKNSNYKILEWLNTNLDQIPIKNQNAEQNDKDRTFKNEYNILKKHSNKISLSFNDGIVPLFTRAYENDVIPTDTENLSFILDLAGNNIGDETKFYRYVFVTNISNISLEINYNFFDKFDSKYINVFANFDDKSYFYNELTDLTIEEEFTYNLKKNKINIIDLFDNSFENGFSGFIKYLYDDFDKNETFENKLLSFNLSSNNNLISTWNEYSKNSKNESINLFKNSKSNLWNQSNYKLDEFTSFLRNNIDLNNLFTKDDTNVDLKINKKTFYNELTKGFDTYFKSSSSNFNELILNNKQNVPNISITNLNIVNDLGQSNLYNFDFYFGTNLSYSNIDRINIVSDFKNNNRGYYIKFKQKEFNKDKNFNLLKSAKENISLVITKGSDKYLAILGQFKDIKGKQIIKPIYIDSKMIDSTKFSNVINRKIN